jgi:hypothetical protein
MNVISLAAAQVGASTRVTVPNIIRMIKSRRMRRATHVARIEEKRNAYRVLIGQSEGKRSLLRPGNRWEDNIKLDLR